MRHGDDPASHRWLVLASATFSFFAVGLGFFSVPPLLPALTARFALSNLAAGVLMGAIAVPAILLSLPLGAAVDRYPPRGAGVLALALMAAGCTLFAAAPSFAVLLLGRLLFGVGALAVNLLEARLLARAFAGREAALAMGVFLAAYPASMILGFSALSPLAAVISWRGQSLLLGALSLLAVPLHVLAVPAGGRQVAAPADAPRARLAVDRGLLALAAAWCLYFAALTPVITFAPQWAGTSGLLVVSVIAWVSLLGGPLAGSLIDRTGRARAWAAGGLVAFAATLAAMALGLLPPVAAMLSVGAVVAVVPTAVYSLPARLVAAEVVGTAFGFITSFSNLGTLAGPAFAGALRDRSSSWPLLWATLGVVTLAALLLALAVRDRRAAGAASNGTGRR
jgi:predicted MFS family arabinose efflux permease